MKIKSFFKTLVLLSIFLPMMGCHDHNHDNHPPAQPVLNGQFIDDIVVGLRFKNSTLSGVTDEKGNFSYVEGELVQFFVGDIFIGEALGKPVLTPIDLVPGASDETNAQVINLIRFIQTLDDDQDPSNGIIISDLITNAAFEKSINFNLSVADFETHPEMQAVLADLTSVFNETRNLVNTRDAQTHFRTSLFALLEGRYRGSFSGDDHGTWELAIDCQGKIEGISTSNEFGSNAIAGSVGIDGVAGISGTAGTSTFSGIFLFDGNVSGTWENTIDNEFGIFSGEHIIGESVFCGLGILNASFEESDPFTFFTGAGNFNTSVQEWDTTQPIGTISPSTPGNPGQFNIFTEDLPDGLNTIFTNGNGRASQVLSTLLTNNTSYQLKVGVGKSVFLNLPDAYSAELRAGGLVLASGTAIPENGKFAVISFEYATQSNDPFGEALEIHLLTNHSSSAENTVQIHWDHVRLFSRTSP